MADTPINQTPEAIPIANQNPVKTSILTPPILLIDTI